MSKFNNKSIKMLLSIFLFIVLSAVHFPVFARAKAPTITVGGDHYFPPYEFINEDGEPDGYNTELTLAIAEVMGIKVEIELGSWDVMKQKLEEGEINLLQGISYSPTRAEVLGFSPPHSIIHESIFARKGASEILDISDLSGKSVIVQSGGIMFEHLSAKNIDIDLIETDTHVEALRLLASGKYDFAFVANLPGLYVGRELLLSNIEPVGSPIGEQRYGYATLKYNQTLLAQFSEGLAILKNTGKQQAIYEKWFGPLLEKKVNLEKVGLFGISLFLFLLLIIGGIVIWNRSLSKEVTKRTREIELQHQQLIQADKMTSLGILVSGVAHEINNPTSLLLLNLPVLKETFDDLEEILDLHYETNGDFFLAGLKYSRLRSELPLMLEDMLEGTNHISRIVNDLRDFTRQEPSHLFESIDFNEVVMVAIRLTDNTIRASTQKFSVVYSDGLPPVKGNMQRLQQVVINLIVNACQALESIDASLQITTFYDTDTESVSLLVKDSGKGIDKANIARLSDPFFTTKREQGGTGLGLSISFCIVEEHSGRLEFDSVPGQGTKVTLYLPRVREK